MVAAVVLQNPKSQVTMCPPHPDAVQVILIPQTRRHATSLQQGSSAILFLQPSGTACRDSCRGAVPAVGAANRAQSPPQLGHGQGRGERAAPHDNLVDLGWEKEDNPLFCGVLGVAETALGPVASLAVSGPLKDLHDVDNDDSQEQTREKFALGSQVSLRHPVQDQPCLLVPGQQLGRQDGDQPL